jgi:hypothetical protein
MITIALTFKNETKAANERGTIIDTVKCKDHPEYSYALYLPEKFTDSVSWPVIYLFDPGARGRMALTNFIQAADLYGYILAASNNSRNGLPEEEIFRISNYLMSDVQKSYTIDNRRIYTSGFSGGSRMAAMIAFKNTTVSGVIGCGAGFPGSTGVKVLPRFDYFGLVGDCDMNYIEMANLKKRFDNTDVTYKLRIFEGGHEWPSNELLQEAVEWMELFAIQKKFTAMDTGFIKYLFQKSESRAQELLKKGSVIESVECYNSISKWLSQYINANCTKSVSDSIQQTKEYLKAIKKNKELQLAEQEFQENALSAFRKVTLMEELPDSVRLWWMNLIKSEKKVASGSDECKQKLARRQLSFLSIQSYETALKYFELKSYEIAANFYQIFSWIHPEDSNIYYLLAQTYALDKDLNNSVKFLTIAVKKGYNNKEAIESDTAFASFNNEKKFREILEQCK